MSEADNRLQLSNIVDWTHFAFYYMIQPKVLSTYFWPCHVGYSYDLSGLLSRSDLNIAYRLCVLCCFITYSKGKTPRRPGPKKANIEKDPVGVSEHFLFC